MRMFKWWLGSKIIGTFLGVVFVIWLVIERSVWLVMQIRGG